MIKTKKLIRNVIKRHKATGFYLKADAGLQTNGYLLPGSIIIADCFTIPMPNNLVIAWNSAAETLFIAKFKDIFETLEYASGLITIYATIVYY